MKSTVLFLVLSALIATSCSAPIDVNDQPIKKVIFTDGKKGPDDTLLGTLTTFGAADTTVNYHQVSWRLSQVKAHIAYVAISELGPSTNATATITSGGVGTDHLVMKAVPYNNGGYNFEVQIWGTIIE